MTFQSVIPPFRPRFKPLEGPDPNNPLTMPIAHPLKQPGAMLTTIEKMLAQEKTYRLVRSLFPRAGSAQIPSHRPLIYLRPVLIPLSDVVI